MSRPNIVFVFSDQQRWDTAGCYGQPLDITPNLDRMAAEGVRFEHTFTCQPVCGPARATLQTGKYPTEVGVHINHRLLPLDEQTLAKRLSASGYEVGYIGKWHLASFGPMDGPDNFRTRPVPPERRGGYVDYWLASDTLEFTSHSYDGHMFDGEGRQVNFPEGRYRADVLTDWTLDYLRSRSVRSRSSCSSPTSSRTTRTTTTATKGRTARRSGSRTISSRATWSAPRRRVTGRRTCPTIWAAATTWTTTWAASAPSWTGWAWPTTLW